MRTFRKTLCLIAVCVLLLCGCTGPVTPTEPTEPPIPVWTGYEGNLDDYVYYYDSGPFRALEEDVLYVAELYLGEIYSNGHPLLTNMPFTTFFGTDNSAFESISHYNEQMRQQFISDISALIPQIEMLQEHQVILQLQKAIARLGDLHSDIYLPVSYWYPLGFMPVYDGDTVQYYATVVPSAFANTGALCAPLVAVNGTPIETVTDLLRQYISYENEYAAAEALSYHLTCNEYLHAAGIADYKDQATTFTFLRADGTTVEVCMASVNAQQLNQTGLFGASDAGFLYHKDDSRNYWWEYQPEARLLYIRFNRMAEESQPDYNTFIKEIASQLDTHPEIKKLVIDLRDNPGGYYNAALYPKLASLLNRMDHGQGYVLLDSRSYSNAIVTASYLKQFAENTVLVGSPGGQPANFYASNHSYTTPNLEYSFSMSDRWWVNDAQDTGPALMPDVFIPQTLEDLIQGKDSVMAYIYAQ